MKLLLTFCCSRKRSSHTLNNWIKIQIVKGFREPVGSKYIEGSACEYGYSFLGTPLSFAVAQNYANAKTTHTHIKGETTHMLYFPLCWGDNFPRITRIRFKTSASKQLLLHISFSLLYFLALSVSHCLLACSFIVFLLFYGLHSWACSSWLRGVIQMHDKFKLVCHLVVSCGRINLNVLRIRYLKC